MGRIIVLLILMNIACPANCSKQVVSVLKYKGGNECSSELVGVPIKSTSTSSVLDEFTFCGKFYFKFLRKSFLMAIEPDFTLGITDFGNKYGAVFYQGLYYKFYFLNQTVTPDSWHYICVAMSPNQIKIVWNGKILLNDLRVDLSKKEITDTKLWLGGALFSDLETNRRFEGMIANANLWNDALQDDDLISITNNKNTVINSTKYDLYFDSRPKNPKCIDILDENEVLFHDLKKENDLLIQYRTNFDSSKYLCQGYGGNLTIPKNDEALKTLGVLIKQSEVCEYAFLGLKKSGNERNSSFLDFKDNVISYLKWGLNQPNGGEAQQCIDISPDSLIYVHDVECDIKHCFICQIP